jgi:hypothetical protein
MKPAVRRDSQCFPYFKLATFDNVSFCFRDGKQAFESESAAAAAAKRPGKYRVSIVTANGRRDLPAFEVHG